jgi:hypothetical protein
MYTTLVYGTQRYTVRTGDVPAILRMAPWLRVLPVPANDVRPEPMFRHRAA